MLIKNLRWQHFRTMWAPCSKANALQCIIQMLCRSMTTAGGHQCLDTWSPQSMLAFAASLLNTIGWTLQVGSTVTFQLLRRPRDTIIPSRVHSSTAEGGQEAKGGAAAGSSPPAGTASSGAASAAASWACRQGIDGKDGTGAKGGPASLRGVPASLFAKYTVVSKPEPLWQVAAAELAEHAAQVGKTLCAASSCGQHVRAHGTGGSYCAGRACSPGLQLGP